MNKRPANFRAPTLRFSPTAWAKLLYLRDCGDTEIGGFGLAAPQDLLYVDDVRLVKQYCSPTSVRFDDASVADFFDAQVDRGSTPDRFARIWLHTHPGASALPSPTDETTFARVFGEGAWAVMFILAEFGQCHARLAFQVGPRGAFEIPVEVDFRSPFAASRHADWEAEYRENVAWDERSLPDLGKPLEEGGDAREANAGHVGGKRRRADCDDVLGWNDDFAACEPTRDPPGDPGWVEVRPRYGAEAWYDA